MYPQGIQSYRKTNVVTADPGRLVLMCYEGAIDQLKIAQQAYQQQDFEAKGRALKKGQDIISELLGSLDFEKGGIVAANLEALYSYMLRRIVQSDVERDAAPLAEIVGLLTELLAAWRHVCSGAGKSYMPQPAQAGKEPLPMPNAAGGY